MSSSRGNDNDNIREYLLGKLTGEDREEFERRVFVDEELFEKVQTAENDLVDDFLTGALSQDDAALFQKNFLVGSKRERELRIGKAWRNYAAAHGGEKRPKPEPEPMPLPVPMPVPGPVPIWHWRQLFSSYPLRIAAFAVVGLIAAVGVWRIFIFQSDVDKGLLALDAAYRQERPLESRITALSYAQFVSTRGTGPGIVNENEIRQAELTLLEVLRNKPTPAARHALGKVYLAKKEFDKAIDLLGEASKGDPNNAQIYADLGAALLEKGKLEIKSDNAEPGKGMEDFARSLENLNKALEFDSNLLEALFNRALLHESMGLLPQAEDDWRRYLESDPNSKWSAEAREKLTQIEQKRKQTSQTSKEIFKKFLSDFDSGNEEGLWTSVSSYQNRTGNVVIEQLIDSYLEAATQNKKEDASRALQQLSYLGDLQIRKNEDRFSFDLARFYRFSTSEQRDLVVKARELMKKAHAGYSKIDYDENRSLFENARELFEQAGDYPEARVAEYWISFCHHNKSKQEHYEQSQQILDSLFPACKKRNYLWLQSRVLYLQSSNEFNLDERSKAVDCGLRSAAIAERTNDSVGLLNAETSLIHYYRYLGDYQKSLAHIQRSLRLITTTTLDPIQGSRHYSFVALAFATMGLHAAAAGYQREALRFALDSGSDSIKSQYYAFLGAIQGKLKNFDEALKSVQLAFDLAQANSAGESNPRLMAYSALQAGNIYREAGDFDKAVDKYTQSIELYKGFPPHLFLAYKGRLFCYLQQHNDQLAREEISILRGLMEKYRSTISDENNRNTFFDEEQSVVDVAIDFEYSRMNNPAQAFNYSNESRARSLLDLLNADKDVTAKVQDSDVKFQAVSEPQPLEKIVQQLPDQTQVLQYVILEDKLLMWVISKNNFQVSMQPVRQKDLNEKLLRFVNIISRPPNDFDEDEELLLAKDLYSILIQPVERLLNKEKVLCIIPDRTLNYLPFSALVSPQSGKFLFEERLLMTSPSASVFLSSSENASRNGEPKDERILSVGNPTFDPAAFPNLDYLPAAGREAASVSALYKSLPLTENKATRTAVMSQIERSDVIHLALHSNIDDEVPLRSKLLLAKSVIEAYEIYNLKLSQARLVVLSSCESGAGRYYNGEGVSSLARAFIGAGVPLVVASLWPVESTATERLMVSLHSHRTRERISTVEALRRAQHDMVHGPAGNFRRPYYWAAFSVTGGYAPF